MPSLRGHVLRAFDSLAGDASDGVIDSDDVDKETKEGNSVIPILRPILQFRCLH